jgi:hypothetical protein
VMVSGLNTDPARDVRPSHSKNQHKGPVTLTTDQRLELSVNLQTSESCREPRQVDPITLLVSTALRMLRTARVPKPRLHRGRHLMPTRHRLMRQTDQRAGPESATHGFSLGGSRRSRLNPVIPCATKVSVVSRVARGSLFLSNLAHAR